MPFEDLTGSSGFTSDSEGVSATLDINMSEDSARNLWDVQAAIQQVAADFQTAVRAVADFNSYLISTREISQTVKMPTMGMEGGEGGNMSYSGGRVDSGSVPMVQSETGMASRIGEMEENASGAGGGVMASRAPNAHPADVGGFVNQMTTAAWMMQGMTGGSGRDPQQQANAVGQGGRAVQGARAVGQAVPAAQQFLRGGGIGGAASLLGRLGAAGAIGYAGYQLADAVMETYAQSRTMAIATNNSQNGVGWGLGRRIGQATMAMSPFVSEEDAANIYNSAIDQGWASRKDGLGQGDFSSAVNFMYGASKDYNMSPEASAQLLQSNTLGAGQSIQALSQQLLTLKQVLDGTGVSMGTATTAFSSFSSFLIGSGASPGDAARIAGGTIKSFAGNTVLGPDASGAMTVQGALQNTQIQAILGGLTGNLPGAALAGSNVNRSVAELEGLVHNLAVQYSSSKGISKENRVALFQTAYNQLTGQNININMAQELMDEASANPNFMTKGQDEYNKSSQMSFEEQDPIEAWWHGLDDTGGWSDSQNARAPTLDEQEKKYSLINSYRRYSPEVNALLNNSGDNLQNMVLYGSDGKPVMSDGNRVAGANIAKWFNSEENYKKFNDPSGGYYIQGQDENKYNSANIGSGGTSAATTPEGATEANTVYITLSPQAKAYFDTDKSKINLSDGKN